MIECVVLWFNQNSGEGMVRSLEDGSTGEIYSCNIKGKKTWYPETACVFYAVGEVVQVSLRDHFIIGETPGIVDSEKWNSLDHSRLAFRCDDDGRAVTGLFATKKGVK